MDSMNYIYDTVENCMRNKNELAENNVSFRIFQWNIRGMNSLPKFDLVKEFLDNYKDRIDIIVLGETWLKEGATGLFEIQGYTSVFSCRRDSHGGLALYVRNDLFVKVVSNEHHEGFHCIHAEVSSSGNPLNIVCVYRPPSYDYADFQDKIDQKLNCISNKRSVFFVGDTNVPVNVSSNNVVKSYRRFLESYNMRVTNTSVTRVASGNILDHVICTIDQADAVINETIHTDTSDHSIILTSLKSVTVRTLTTLTKRIINHNQLNDRLAADLIEIPRSLSANEKLMTVINKFEEAQAAATKVVVVQAKVKDHCPWMTFDVWKMMKIKDNLLKSSRRHPSDQHLRDLLKHASKRLQQIKERSKRDYYQRLLLHSSNKKSWKMINELLGRKNDKERIVTLKIGDSKTSDGYEVSNIFNNWFSNVGENLASGINSDKDIRKFRTLPTQSSSIYLQPATVEEVILLIKNLDSKKSPGPDSISAETIKNHHVPFANILVDVFNEIIVSGEFPACLKIARVVPIFKSGDPADANNYRPISVLSMMSKLLEKMIASRLSDFLFTNNLIYEKQYGFRTGCSTLTATCEMVDEIYGILDRRQFSGALFLDLKKAFDTINHDLLLQKLECYGIRGTALLLLQSYLRDRQQYVTANGGKSDLRNISIGVPQGSNLGPLLFLVFINDLSRLKLHGKMQFFADDTVLLYNALEALRIARFVQEDLQSVQEYFASNVLSLNLQKTTYMIFHTPRRPSPELPAVRVGTIEIRKVDSFKYLGLTLDSVLSWEQHIESLKNKTAVLCGIFRRLSSFIPTSWLLKLYYSLVHSRLQYLVCIWGNASKSRLRELQVLQNRCLKVIFKRPHLFPTIQLYNDEDSSLLPIRGLQMLQMLTHMHNIITNADTHHNVQIIRNSSARSSRYAGNIRLARPNSELGKRRFSYQGSKSYNELPPGIKQQLTVILFKKELRQHLKLHINHYLV